MLKEALLTRPPEAMLVWYGAGRPGRLERRGGLTRSGAKAVAIDGGAAASDGEAGSAGLLRVVLPRFLAFLLLPPGDQGVERLVQVVHRVRRHGELKTSQISGMRGSARQIICAE